MENNIAPSIRPAVKITTKEGAARLGTKAQTWRAGYCRDGVYLGMVPVKLPNGRLLWDEGEVNALANGRPVKTPAAEVIDAHRERKAAAGESKIPAHILAKRATAAGKALTSGEVRK